MSIWQDLDKRELYHHGILGMKWGVRRYQNKDGSLTPRGKSRLKEQKSEKVRDKEVQEFKNRGDASWMLDDKYAKQWNDELDRARKYWDYYDGGPKTPEHKKLQDRYDKTKKQYEDLKRTIDERVDKRAQQDRSFYDKYERISDRRAAVTTKDEKHEIEKLQKKMRDIDRQQESQLCKDLGYKDTEENRRAISYFFYLS